jgi:hypothetical protein
VGPRRRSVEVTSWTGGVGTTFDTFAKNDRGRMSYEVTEAEPTRRYPAVTRSGLFRLAQWQFDLEAADHGTSVACVSDFALRFRYLLLAPVFALLVGRAIRRDLAQLELVVQAGGGFLAWECYREFGGRRALYANAPVTYDSPTMPVRRNQT